MPIFKKQRFKHSAEVEKHLRDRGVGGTHYRNGKKGGTWYDIDKDQHIHVKDGEIGPASNLFIVAALSTAGLLVLVFAVASIFG